jgi:hypothetical protein
MKFGEHRKMAEFALVGSCILENKHKHFTYLSSKNFHKWGEIDLPFIWDCLPGDIHLVADNAKKKGRDEIYNISFVTDFTVYGLSELQRIALGLMEDEYRNGFISVLMRLGAISNTPVLRAAISEVLAGCSNYDIDVFELIDSGSDYLNSFGNDSVGKMLAQFNQRVINKNKEIKAIHDRI